MSRFLPLAVGVVLCACAVACGSTPEGPTSPTATLAAPLGSQRVGSNSSIRSALTTHGQELTAVVGVGSGIVNVTPTAAADGSFSAQINVNVHDAPPNTTFFDQRAPEIGRPNGADGVCHLEHDHLTPGQCQPPGDCEADHAGADHDTLDAFGHQDPASVRSIRGTDVPVNTSAGMNAKKASFPEAPAPSATVAEDGLVP